MPPTLPDASRLTLGAPASLTRNDGSALNSGRDLREELAPRDRPLVPDDVDARHAAAFHQVVADARRFDAAHRAHIVFEPACDADAVVAVLVEEPQHAALQGRGRRAPAPPATLEMLVIALALMSLFDLSSGVE